jgi:N-acetylmuramoyl-L-alanine amidase
VGRDLPPAARRAPRFNRFPDLDPNTLEAWAANYLADRAIISGRPDGLFHGEDRVDRADSIKIVLRARVGDVPTFGPEGGGFPDVPLDAWFHNYVIYAARTGIIHGHPDGFYRPEDTVNTVELLKMLTLAFNLNQQLPHRYTDIDLDEWYAPFVGIAVQYDLFPYRPLVSLVPAQPLTRSEFAIAVYQLLTRLLEEQGTWQ